MPMSRLTSHHSKFLILAAVLFTASGALVAGDLLQGGGGASGVRFGGGEDTGGSIPKSLVHAAGDEPAVAAVIGNLASASGYGLSGYVVEVRGPMGQQLDVTVTDVHGNFVLCNIPNISGCTLNVLATPALDIPVQGGDVLEIVVRL